MEFKNQIQKEIYMKVKDWLLEAFGEMRVTILESRPAIVVKHGSALAQVHVLTWGDDETNIITRSYVVSGAEIDEELMRFLLHENEKKRFGAFGLDEDDDIIFEHTIVGSTAQRMDVVYSVHAVISTADEFDDKIISRWGGKSALDKLRQS